MSQPIDDKDRRRSRRIRRRLNVTLTRPTGDSIRAQTADVSSFGFRLLLDRNTVFAKNERLHLTFNEFRSETDVRVVWAARRQDCVFAGLEKVPSLKGGLETNHLYEILFGLVMRRMTGEILFRRGTVSKSVFLDMGEIVAAESDQDYDSLPSVLVRGGRISQTEFDEAWATHVKRPTTPLDKILVEMGCLDAESLADAMIFRTRRIVRGLFEWSEGNFEFIEHRRPVREGGRLGVSTADLIVSGIRSISADRFREILNPIFDIPVAMTEDPLRLYQKITLMEKEKALLARVDGKTTLRALIHDSDLTETAAMSAATVLLGTYLVELGEAIQDTDIPDRDSPTATDTDVDAIASRVDRIYYRLSEMTHYDVLGLTPQGRNAEIKKAYYNMARDFHPDLNHRLGPGYEPKLHAIFTRINDVYHVLSDEKRRRDYDKTIYVGTRGGMAGGSKPPSKHKPGAQDRYRQGNLKYKAGDYAGAAEMYRMAAQSEPEKAIYQFAAGKALLNVPRRRKEAEECFLKAIEIEPYNSNYLLELGNLYLKARLATRARRTFTEVLNMEPDSAAAKRGLQKAERL